MSLEIRRTRGSSSHRYENIFNVFVFLSFTAITALTAQLFSPLVKTNAEEQTATYTAGDYTISMTKDDSNPITFNIYSSAQQTVFDTTDTFTITNSCPKGATVTINTNSNSDTDIANNLYRIGNDDYPKIIKPTTGNNLVNSSWGFSTDDGKSYHAIPAKDQTPAAVYNTLSNTTNSDTVTVKYGIKADNHIPPGDYSNDIVYSVTVNPLCLKYDVTWNLEPFFVYFPTPTTTPSSLNYDESFVFSTIAPAKRGYTLESWTASYDGGSTTILPDAIVNPNPTNATSITFTPNWVLTVYHITYELDGGTIENAPTSYTIDDGYLTLPRPTKPGFTFKGWTYGDYTTPAMYSAINTEIASDLTYTAHWEADTPIMQTFNKTTLTDVGDSVLLRDARDDNVYTVKKLADGNVWMTENLRIINKTISSTDSNIPEGGTWTIPDSDISAFNNKTNPNSAYYDSTYGGYYSFYTATAGWGNSDIVNDTSPRDICPKGWRLPTGGPNSDFSALYNQYKTSALMQGEPGFVLSGNIRSNIDYIVDTENAGTYWSSTAGTHSSNAYYLLLYTNSIIKPDTTRDTKYQGNAIRCIAK